MQKSKNRLFILSLIFALLVTTSCARMNLLVNWSISIDPPVDKRYVEDEVDNVEAYQVWEYGGSSVNFLGRMTQISDDNVKKAETYLNSLLATLAYYPNKVDMISQAVERAQLISNGNYVFYDTKRENTVLLLIFDVKKGEMYCFSSE